MSESANPLIVQPDGTALDPNTGLIWMMALVGQGWSNGKTSGEAATLSWGEATSRYGKARNINATGMDCNWAGRGSSESDKKTAYFKKYPLGQETYKDYRRGRKRLAFAGFDDWRLPTVEEFWKLSLTDYAKTPLDVEPRRMWTANPSNSSLVGFFMALLDMGWCAWEFHLFPREDVSNGFGDMKTQFRRPLRLVRGGTMFEAIH
jgi:hypothetical protein